VPDGNNIPGHIVISASGRDAGHAYVVLGWYKPQTLLVADGRGRTVSNPKKKNVKHVKPLNTIANKVTDALVNGLTITDEDIRQDLAHIEATR
jgi:ribosomal protein L14E/L6E/L27E